MGWLKRKRGRRKQRVLLTGATGGMGRVALDQLLMDTDIQVIHVLALGTKEDRKRLKRYRSKKGLVIHWGDLTDYQKVYQCVAKADIILHVGALVSPAADYHPKKAMEVNFGSMKNLIQAIREQNRLDEVRLVSIGTIAETGDRMPPIHWGRVGDPIKPSIYDYYAVSKVAAERLLIESGLKYWVSLRQTGIMGPAMARIKDAIMFHNCLDNVLEYVSDRDSGLLLRNLCRKEYTGELADEFWGHIYNIGGGETCRVSTLHMYKQVYGLLGIKDLRYVVDPTWYATRNFHGQFYLDSDKLDKHLDFRHDSMDYFYQAYVKSLGIIAPISRFICKFPGGQWVMGEVLKKALYKDASGEHGTIRFINENMEEQIDAYWGSRENWAKIPKNIHDVKSFTDWNRVVPIDHGYDESKPENMLTLGDMRGAAVFRGGTCDAETMNQGDWKGKLTFTCAFGHTFKASPRLILEGGHWCPDCERKSWNYAERARVDPFFAQVWDPIQHPSNHEHAYVKVVSELDVD